MKKIFLTATAMVLTTFFFSANAGSAGKDKESRKQLRKERKEKRHELWLHSVNMMTESQFYRDFPDATNVSWTEGAFAEASFEDKGISKIAYYDMEDELVGVTSHASI